jgi:tRNA G18 (ribose-2'-O)-methylase SpoU
VCTRLVTIQGTGHVESLNVSVAGAILMDRLFGGASRVEK